MCYLLTPIIGSVPGERVPVAVMGVGGPLSHQWNRLSPWERVPAVIPAIDLGGHYIWVGSRCSYFSASRWDSHRHNRLGPRKGVHVVVMEIDDLRSHLKDRLGTRRGFQVVVLKIGNRSRLTKYCSTYMSEIS